MNSRRSPKTVLCSTLQSKNATREANSLENALRAKSAPLLGSSSLTTCGEFAARWVPSTSSYSAVTESRRTRPERFVSRKTMNFSGASTAT